MGETKILTPALLRQIGEALYGPRWQVGLGRLLGRSGRMVRYWVAGEVAIPEEARSKLRAALKERREDCSKLAELLT